MCVDPATGDVTILPELELPHLRVKIVVIQGKLCIGIYGLTENNIEQYYTAISCKYQVYEFNRNTAKWSIFDDSSLLDSDYVSVFHVGQSSLCVADLDSGLYEVNVKSAPSKLISFSGITEVCPVMFPEIIGTHLTEKLFLRSS